LQTAQDRKLYGFAGSRGVVGRAAVLPSSFGSLLRLGRAGLVLARAGVFSDLDPAILPPAARIPLALARLLAPRRARTPAPKTAGKSARGLANLPAAISRLGPSYVKLGQFLATRPDVVGTAVARQLEFLQDRMEPFPRTVAIATIEAAFGEPLGRVFTGFEEAVAAASIAQVHRARVKDGESERDVAVKVLRPGVERLFRRDLGDIYFAARLGERWSREARRLKLVEVVDTLARTVKMEMDFRLEAAAASEFAENTAQDKDFRIPQIDWDRTTKEVLTLEWIDGTPLSDIKALAAKGYDLQDLGRIVVQSFLRTAMRDGFFHADMHRGNLFVDPQGRLTAVDFGIMGRLGHKERRFLAEILYGFIKRDYRRVAEVHFEAGYVPRVHKVEDFAQAIRAIGEPIHSRPADQISMAKLLTLLFEITGLFDMKTRTELVLLQKTMVVTEGVARTLDPKLDVWTTAEPVVGEWIEQNLGPIGKLQDAGRAASTLARFAANLPSALLRGEIIVGQLEGMAENGVELSESAIAKIGKAEARGARFGHIALWLIVALGLIMLLR
jgi:ubiquinone biosynthesis protein